MNELYVVLTIITTFAVFAIICISLIFHIIRELRRVYEIGFHLKEIVEDTKHQIHSIKQDVLEEVDRRMQQNANGIAPSPPASQPATRNSNYGKVLTIGENGTATNPGRKGQAMGRN